MADVDPQVLTLINEAVTEAFTARPPDIRFVPGTFEGTDQGGDGIVRLDSDDEDSPDAVHAPVVGPHPVYGARVIVAMGKGTATYILGEVAILKQGSELVPRVVLDTPTGEMQSYDANGNLIGKMSASQWYAGVEDGPRTQIDPLGGARVFDADGHLALIADSGGVQVRDPVSGVVHGHLGGDGLTLRSHGGNLVEIVPDQPAVTAPPKWAGTYVGLPGSSHTTPSVRAFTTADLELRYIAAWSNGVLAGPESMTPPAGFTEQLDTADLTAGNSMLVSVASRQPASPQTVQTLTSTDTFWQYDNGHTVVCKGGGPTAPSVRAVNHGWSIFNTGSFLFSLGPPATLVAGDLMIAYVAVGNDGGPIPQSWSVPMGWEMLGAGFFSTGSGSGQSTLASGVWYKIATAEDVALAGASGQYNVSVTMAGSTTSTKKVSATIVTVQDVAQNVGGADVRFDPASRMRAYSNTNRTLTVGADTLAHWHVKNLDPGSNLDLTTHRYTCPQGGPYQVNGHLVTVNTAAGERFVLRLRLNGITVAEGSDIVSSGGSVTLTIWETVDCAQGDILDLVVLQVNGTARSIFGSTTEKTYWSVQRSLST